MPRVHYGGRDGKSMRLEVSLDRVAIRTRSRHHLVTTELSPAAAAAVATTASEFRLAAAGVEVRRVPVRRGAREVRDHVRITLAQERDVEFAGRVLHDPVSGVPALYSENAFVRFRGSSPASRCRQILERHGLSIKREIPYLDNAYFVGMPQGSGQAVFDVAERLLDEPDVDLSHPEILWQGSRRGAFALQWHLGPRRFGEVEVVAHSFVEEAWAMTRGEGTVIAVIDDGFDIGHEELSSPGKVVSPFDATERSGDPRPGAGNDHGTACAGIACADGLLEAAGVAPRARLLPVRLVSGLGSQDEADALVWAAQNGADVISCSWGPEDGDSRDPDDPRHLHEHPLPDSTRLALEWATEHGRGGRGCVVVWAAGNGNESVDLDGYASSDRVVAVAACNDEGKRCAYSDFGKAVWCCFPSGEVGNRPTTGIWTTDRSGRDGYNPGRSRLGDRRGRYTNAFRGTSASTPGVAGVAALVLAVAPHLGWRDVKELLRTTAEPIDPQEGEYDAGGHSSFYGYGRAHAARVVAAARAQATGEAAVAAPPVQRLIEIEVHIEGVSAEATLLLDGRPLVVVDGVARTVLPAGEAFMLGWHVVGAAGARYNVSVRSANGEVRGAFPVAGRIPKRGSKSAGSRRLSIVSPRRRSTGVNLTSDHQEEANEVP